MKNGRRVCYWAGLGMASACTPYVGTHELANYAFFDGFFGMVLMWWPIS